MSLTRFEEERNAMRVMTAAAFLFLLVPLVFLVTDLLGITTAYQGNLAVWQALIALSVALALVLVMVRKLTVRIFDDDDEDPG